MNDSSEEKRPQNPWRFLRLLLPVIPAKRTRRLHIYDYITFAVIFAGLGYLFWRLAAAG